MVELSAQKEIIQGCKYRENTENTLAADSLILHMMSFLGLSNSMLSMCTFIRIFSSALATNKMLTSSIHFLFIDDVPDCVWEEDGIIFSTKIHPNKVGRRSSDGKDDVFLRGKIEWDPPHGQLAGEQQKLPNSWKWEIRKQHESRCQRYSVSQKHHDTKERVKQVETTVDCWPGDFQVNLYHFRVLSVIFHSKPGNILRYHQEKNH